MHTLNDTDTEPDPPPLVCSVDETARLLGVSKMTIYRLLRSGELHRLKIGHRCLIRRCEIERFLLHSDTRYPTTTTGNGGRHG